MKTLHLIRHAKSSWAYPELSDKERPLNDRGIETCALMAPDIAEAGCPFSNVWCSSAVRAQSTIELIADALPSVSVSWQTDETLYTFSGATLLHWCQALDDAQDQVVLVGHNPAITEFCNGISGADIENIPTCGYARLVFDGEHWSDLAVASAKLVCFLIPEKGSK